ARRQGGVAAVDGRAAGAEGHGFGGAAVVGERPRSGLATVAPVQVESPNCRLCVPVKAPPEPNEQLPPLLPAMMVLFITVVGVRGSKSIAPPPVPAMLPATVQFVMMTGSALTVMAEPSPVEPAMLPVKVLLEMRTPPLPELSSSMRTAPPPNDVAVL